ncbi:hypothetical protein H0H81_004460 [Sphagnurus paluster]|uniref:TLC domain-containing protein n=1 Tax=Sphagnurus paluster TaxID=117069 RepID=A0A9P7GSD2_9AGAR|nr:hypothetical protein H0H81_004460 [Sphagnurus paluster]
MTNSEPLKLFAAFTVYYLVERVLRHLLSRSLLTPDFLSKLRASRKEPAYFGIFFGALISVFSFPFCANAFWQYTPLPFLPAARLGDPLSLSAEICITSRGVLWVSELNRLDLYAGYVYHHLGSIVMLLSAFYLDALELLYLPLVTLVSEVPGDFVWIMAAHQDMDTRCIGNQVWGKWRKDLQAANVWVYALARLPSIPIIAYSAFQLTQTKPGVWTPEARLALLVWVFFVLALYLGWVVAYLKRQLQASQPPHAVSNEKGQEHYTDAPTQMLE